MKKEHQTFLEKFAGCDAEADDTPEKGSVWLFGIEHGWPKNAEETRAVSEDDTYSIKTQRQWPFNRNAFKLLTIMAGRQITEWTDYAEEHQPFVRGSKGFFKGNLYPFPCHNTGEWSDSAKELTGFSQKDEYKAWCHEHRLPVIKSWVDEYTPSIFIGVGNQYVNEFSLAAFGKLINFDVLETEINGYTKRLYYAEDNGLKLVVIPHLSRGLNSHKSQEWAGSFTRNFISA